MSLQSIMDVYIIHLPSHLERRHQIERQMERIGLSSYTFVTPETIAEEDVGENINRPSRSLYETNIALMEKTQHKRNPYVLILEDDVVTTVPPENVLPTIQNALKTLTTIRVDWDMLYLEYCCETCILAKKVANGLIQSRNPSCTAAILYRRDKFSKILPFIKKYRKEKQIDHAYKYLIQKGFINAYSVYPALFRQDTEHFPSSLETFYIKRFLFGYSSCDTIMWIKLGIMVIVVIGVFLYLYLRIRLRLRRMLKP